MSSRNIHKYVLAFTLFVCITFVFVRNITADDGFTDLRPRPFTSKNGGNGHGNGNGNGNGKQCMVSFGEYHGHMYRSPPGQMETVGEGKCLVESKWMKVMQHTVELEGDKGTIDDWLFIDYHDRINVLVQAPSRNTNDSDGKEEPTFLVFRQSKYALEGRSSLAIIGGIIEPGEDAETAAKREVHEEMDGLSCDKMEFLGRYRTDVNRGIGWVNSFLARDCKRGGGGDEGQIDGVDLADEVGKADTERQDLLTLTLSEVRQSAKEGRFLEVQWSNTVALALLHLL